MPPPTRRRRSGALTSITVAALVAACGGGSESETPQISLDEEAALTELLLTPADVAVISGFDGAEARDLEQVQVFENPDPRGPCGAPVDPPSFADASGRALTGATIGLIQLVMPAEPEHQRYLGSLVSDQGPPCEDYVSTTNTGEEQIVSEITVYDATGEAVSGVAWTNLVEVDGKFVYAGVVALEAADMITFVQVQSASAIPEEGIELLAGSAVLRLRQDL